MPITQISERQIRPVDPARVAAAEKTFQWFFFVAASLCVAVLISMFISRFHSFWIGNRIWSIGSFFVCVSVLHSRFFDIKKNAAPHNQRIDADSLSRTTAFLENLCAHVWLLGFALLAVARWKPY
jgi:hypothetical protein